MTVTTGESRDRLVFGGIPEDEGWQAAPLESMDRVHFRTSAPVVLEELRADLPIGSALSLDEGTGLYRVDCRPGNGTSAGERVRRWCHARGVQTEGLRCEKDVRRRALRDLDPYFLDDLCAHYVNFSWRRLHRNMSTILCHIPDHDDVRQQIFEWILDAVTRFDHTKGVPFGAFLAGMLSRWVHDLGRRDFGRTAADAELQHQRAVASFTQQFERQPSERELADFLGQSLVTLRRNRQIVATVNGLRNMQTLDVTGDDADIAIPDAHRAEDEIMDDTTTSLISHALTAACEADPTARGRAAQPNVLGWIATYETTWGGRTKTELADRLSTSVRNMNVYADRVQDGMRGRLAGALS